VKSNSRSNKQFYYRRISLDTRNKEKRRSFTTQQQYVWASAVAENMRILQGKPILQVRTSMEGEQQHPRRQHHLRRSPTEPRTATQSEDLRPEGRRQHHAQAIAARVSSRSPARADGSAGRPEASASYPPRTSARPMASATRLRRQSCQWTARSGSGRRSLLFEPTLPLSTLIPLPPAPAHRRATEGFPLTKQEKPRVARPTEQRDSYASGIRIPHSSPLDEATHTW
jgi:hypothetical protein